MSYRISCELGNMIKGMITVASSFGIKRYTNPSVTFSSKGLYEQIYTKGISLTKGQWKAFPNLYTCNKGVGINMLIISGSEDLVFPFKGFGTDDVFSGSVPPHSYGAWYFANLNYYGSSQFSKGKEYFNEVVTYEKRVY